MARAAEGDSGGSRGIQAAAIYQQRFDASNAYDRLFSSLFNMAGWVLGILAAP
jgi:hypothetical protein